MHKEAQGQEEDKCKPETPVNEREHESESTAKTDNRIKEHGQKRSFRAWVRLHGREIDILSNTIIAVFAVIVGGTSIKQSLDTRDALTESRRANELARDALRIGNQSWLTVEELIEGDAPKDGGKEFLLTIKNTGGVPAQDIQVHTKIGNPDTTLPILEALEQVRSVPEILASSMVKGTNQVITQAIKMSDVMVTAVLYGDSEIRRTIYIDGWITYRDGFSGDRETGFCFMLAGTAEHAPKPFEFVFCPAPHNWAK